MREINSKAVGRSQYAPWIAALLISPFLYALAAPTFSQDANVAAAGGSMMQYFCSHNPLASSTPSCGGTSGSSGAALSSSNWQHSTAKPKVTLALAPNPIKKGGKVFISGMLQENVEAKTCRLLMSPAGQYTWTALGRSTKKGVQLPYGQSYFVITQDTDFKHECRVYNNAYYNQQYPNPWIAATSTVKVIQPR